MWVQPGNQGQELITPPLDGTILPGITRDSILRLAQSWGQFEVSERYMTLRELTQVRKHIFAHIHVAWPQHRLISHEDGRLTMLPTIISQPGCRVTDSAAHVCCCRMTLPTGSCMQSLG